MGFMGVMLMGILGMILFDGFDCCNQYEIYHSTGKE
jgi:hypothetical protein